MNIEERADFAEKLGRLSYIIRTANRLVRDCAWVQPGDEVVIITDADVSPLITHALAGEVLAVGGVPNILEMPIQDVHGNEPGLTTQAACMAADVIFGAVSKSLTHTKAIQDALERDTPAISACRTSARKSSFAARRPPIPRRSGRSARNSAAACRRPRKSV